MGPYVERLACTRSTIPWGWGKCMGEGCVVWVVATTGPSELGFADKEKELDMSAHILAQGFQRLNEASP